MIIVDTNVTSELMKPTPSPAVTAWVRACNTADLYTTAITLAEILYGIERLPDGPRKDLLRHSAAGVFSGFPEQVLPFDATAAVAYSEIVTHRESVGAPIDGVDAQIAAICRAHNATLATRNLKDFRDTGVDVIDPWEMTR